MAAGCAMASFSIATVVGANVVRARVEDFSSRQVWRESILLPSRLEQYRMS